MKRIFLLLTLFFIMGAQTVKAGDVTFSQVVETPGYTRDVLYEKIKIWIAQNFKSAKAVLEYENKETGTIIGNGMISYPCHGFGCISKGDWKVRFTMKVDIKDDKFRLTFNNISYEWPSFHNSAASLPAGEKAMPADDEEDIKPKLIVFGDEIKSSLSNTTTSDKW